MSLRGGVLSEQLQLTLEYWRRDDDERGCAATAKHRRNARMHVVSPLSLRLGAATSADANTDVAAVTASAAEVAAFDEMVRSAWLPAAPPEFPTSLFWDDGDPRMPTTAVAPPPLCWGVRVGTRQAAAQAKTASVLRILADSVSGPSAHGASHATAPTPAPTDTTANAAADADATTAADDDDATTMAIPNGVFAAMRREGVVEVGTDAPGGAVGLVRALGAALGAPTLFVGSEAIGASGAAAPLLQLPLVASGGAVPAGGTITDVSPSHVAVRASADAFGTAIEAGFHEAARPVYGRGVVSGVIFGKVRVGGNLTVLQRLLLAQGGLHTALAPRIGPGSSSSFSTAVGRALLGALSVEDSTRSYLRVAATLPACGARCARLPSMAATATIRLATSKNADASPVLSLRVQLNRSQTRLELEVPDSASVEELTSVVLSLGGGEGEAGVAAAAEPRVTDTPLLGVAVTLELGAEGSMSPSTSLRSPPPPPPAPPLSFRADLPLAVLSGRIGGFKRGESCEVAAGLSLRMRVDLRGTNFAPTMDGSLGCNLALECSARVSNPTARLTAIASVFELPLFWALPYDLQTGISRDGASRRWAGGEVLVGSMTMSGSGPAVLSPQSTTVVRLRLAMCPPAETCTDGVASKDGSALDWRPWGGVDRGQCCAASRVSLCTRTFGLICDSPPLIGPLALTQGGDAQEMLLRELLRCLSKLSNDLQSLGRSVSYWRAVSEGGRVGFQLGKFVVSIPLPRFVLPTASVRCTVFHRDGTMAAPERATMSDAIHMLAFDQYSVCLLQC